MHTFRPYFHLMPNFFIHEQASILAQITQVDFLQSYPLITPITNLMLIWRGVPDAGHLISWSTNFIIPSSSTPSFASELSERRGIRHGPSDNHGRHRPGHHFSLTRSAHLYLFSRKKIIEFGRRAKITLVRRGVVLFNSFQWNPFSEGFCWRGFGGVALLVIFYAEVKRNKDAVKCCLSYLG